MNSEFETEDYAVEPPKPPETFDLLASGVKVAEVATTSDFIYVQNFKQHRIFIKDMITGVENYARRINRHIQWSLWDSEYDRFEFYTSPLEENNASRAIGDNPQA